MMRISFWKREREKHVMMELSKNRRITIERTRICGGGAKSLLWRTIIANVMNLRVDVMENEEGPALGGAILAAVGCGEYENVETAVRCLVRVAETVEPTPELAEKYERKYRSFQQIYPAVKGLFSGALV